MAGRNKWPSVFLFLCMWVGWEREIRNASPKNGVRRFWGVRPWGILMGQQRDAEHTDVALEQWIASLCRAALFNVGGMARVLENIYS